MGRQYFSKSKNFDAVTDTMEEMLVVFRDEIVGNVHYFPVGYLGCRLLTGRRISSRPLWSVVARAATASSLPLFQLPLDNVQEGRCGQCKRRRFINCGVRCHPRLRFASHSPGDPSQINYLNRTGDTRPGIMRSRRKRHQSN